jgi:O-succinylbenzoic acid--CoA ligase
MPHLVAIDLPGGDGFVDAVRRVWDRGDAVLPIDQRLAGTARARLLEALRPDRLLDAAGEHHLAGDPVEPGDALVMPTSGSTGHPKGVVHTMAALEASARAGNARLGVTAGDHWLACLPLAHIGGFTVVTKALVAGSRLTVLPGFDAAAVTAAAHAGATHVSLVATALARIDPTLFRIVLLGGSRPPADRPANVIATYGLTETGSGVVYNGTALDGVELRITPDDEILVRGPMVMRGYRDGTTAVDHDGWLHTDDIGRLVPDGRLDVQGRRGDMIVTGGENVWPDAVERVLATLPGVTEVAVAGVTDPVWGQRVVAWIVPSDHGAPPTLAQLRDAVAAELATFMAPKELLLVGALPRTPLGKVVRTALVANHPASPAATQSDD